MQEKHMEFIVMCVGVGGTGGNFIKEFTRYATYFHKENVSIKIVLIDGDKVEKKNEERQPFIDDDIEQFKSVVLASALKDSFGYEEITAYPVYIDEVSDLDHIYSNVRKFSNYKTGYERGMSIPVLIGAVDNHRARQVMEEWFYRKDNVFYFDSANEYTVGELVLSARMNGELVAPPRSFYFPDVLTDTSPSAKELSCGVVNVSSPQHLATNLFASVLLMSAVSNLLSDNTFEGGITYFSRDSLYSKFYSYESVAKQRGGVQNAEKES